MRSGPCHSHNISSARASVARLYTDLPCLPFFAEPIYGGADWAAGFTAGEPAEEIQQEVQDQADGTASLGEWSYVQKGALFAVIVGCVALYVRISRKRDPRDAGYEKTMA